MRFSISFRQIHVFFLDNYYDIKQNYKVILISSGILTVINYLFLLFYRQQATLQAQRMIIFFLGINPIWVFITSIILVITFRSVKWLEVFTNSGVNQRIKKQEIEKAMQVFLQPENPKSIDPEPVQNLKKTDRKLSKVREQYVKSQETIFDKMKQYYNL